VNKELRNIILLFITHFSVLLVGYITLNLTGLANQIPNNSNLLNWDASWYNSINQDGYIFDESVQSNTGFFPLFPMLWRLFQFSPVGVSIFNVFLYAIGATVMTLALQRTWKDLIVLIGLPSLFFFYIPYSEALFYLMGSLLLVGLYKERKYLFYISLLLSCMIRPVFFFFIPALIMLFLLKRNSGFNWKKLLLSILLVVIGTVLSFWIVGYSSGDFFAYTKSQIGNWDHSFSLPGFPLTTWRGYRILWLDGLALFLLGVVGLFILKNFKSQLNSISSGKSKNSLTEIFAIIGLVMSLFYVLFFHLEEDGRTSLMSLNRYVLCSPLLHFLILQKVGRMDFSFGKMTLPILAGLMTIVLFGFPYIEVVGLSMFNSIPFLLGCLVLWLSYYFILFKHKSQLLFIIGFYTFNVTLQLYLFQSFLKGNWIG